ncbi:hypothetical protein [Streptomyces massasporeus]|uniref:hypothetical protein n=1 Tax=Streptomyces massasporeus TaxID=67324 RepID=UPI00365C425D
MKGNAWCAGSPSSIRLAFLGSTFTRRERLMVGALGPRGTTSIVFGLLARSLTPAPSAAGGPGSPGTDEPDSRVVAMPG